MTFTPPTLLELSGITLGDYSCRGLTMTLAPIQAQDGLRRTVNGGLISLSPPQFQKYAVSISCTDAESPILDGIWQGQAVSVTCIPNMGANNTAGILTLSMLVDSWNVSTDEWGCETSWTINLLEV